MDSYRIGKYEVSIDPSNTTDSEDRDCGWIPDGDGGWFFTWLDSRRETVASIEADPEAAPDREIPVGAIEAAVSRAWTDRYGRDRDAAGRFVRD